MDKFNQLMEKLIQDDGLNITVNIKFPAETIAQIGATALIVVVCAKILGKGIEKLF